MKQFWIGFALASITAVLAVLLAPRSNADVYGWIDSDDNPALTQAFINAVGVMEDKYGTGSIEVSTAWLDDPNAIAGANADGIVINKNWSRLSIAEWEASRADDIASGYHNPGCNAVAAIAIHETAHVIDWRQGFIGRQRLANAAPYMSGELSKYSFDPVGNLDPAEAIAEAFQAVECGSADAVEYELHSMLVG